VFLVLSVPVFAETEYALLETLDGELSDQISFSAYMAKMFQLAMGLAVVLAVFQISYGGFLYITSDSFNKTALGREKVSNAIIGLLLLLTSYLILNTIDPDLVNFDFKIPPAQSKDPSVQFGDSD